MVLCAISIKDHDMSIGAMPFPYLGASPSLDAINVSCNMKNGAGDLRLAEPEQC
jgi:hypothetical protein